MYTGAAERTKTDWNLSSTSITNAMASTEKITWMTPCWSVTNMMEHMTTSDKEITRSAIKTSEMASVAAASPGADVVWVLRQMWLGVLRQIWPGPEADVAWVRGQMWLGS